VLAGSRYFDVGQKQTRKRPFRLESTGAFMEQRLNTRHDIRLLDITPWKHDIQKKHWRMGRAGNSVHSKRYLNISAG